MQEVSYRSTRRITARHGVRINSPVTACCWGRAACLIPWGARLAPPSVAPARKCQAPCCWSSDCKQAAVSVGPHDSPQDEQLATRTSVTDINLNRDAIYGSPCCWCVGDVVNSDSAYDEPPAIEASETDNTRLNGDTVYGSPCCWCSSCRPAVGYAKLHAMNLHGNLL